MTRTARETRTGTDYTHQALLALGAAKLTWAAYQARLDRAIAKHGARRGFPEQTKTELRALARAVGSWHDTAATLWRKSGRRINTLRPFLEGRI